ncbi:unnamed protein product, partial [Allacma fusca]
MKTMLIICSML